MDAETGTRRSTDESALVVSTRCPSCAAPLDFAQGSNAIRCAHCASNLLATGRGQVLSYLVRPHVGGADARAIARFAPGPSQAGARLGEPRLCFVPYYRLTANEMRWQHRGDDESVASRAASVREASPSALRTVLELAQRSGVVPSPRVLLSAAARRRPPAAEFAARRIERTLNATTGGIGAPSLGVRSSVVRLELFHDGALPEDAVVAPADLSATDALRIALTPTGFDEIVARAVVTRVLSLLHFPFWTVRVETRDGARSIVVDAVSGSIVATDASASALERAREDAQRQHPTVGFRPLVCPNCGWDLPVEPAAVAFPCAGCDRAWLLDGTDLVAQPTSVATPPADTGVDAVDYRPFWEVAGPGPTSGANASTGWLIPAFEHGNVKRLRDLALRLSRRRPSFIAMPPGTARVDLGGCVLDAADAAAIAAFLAATGDERQRPAPSSAATAAATEPLADTPQLLWLPFVRDAYGWREPLTGTALPPELAA